MAKFHVTTTFWIESKQWFVLAGSIVEGVIRPGMMVNIPLNGSVSLSEPVDSIEFARREGGEDVCLCLVYDDPEVLSVWQAMDICDEVLEISPKEID
ncbi:MAG: hypothetical protein IMF08_14495 [Proteobacteria bacterium]|nr:hypothetical protein [Pseudomonadota bacterium]